jgi:PAS domain S-box-containing protein
MKALLLLTADEELRARLLHAFGDWSVFVIGNDREALATVQLADIDLVLRDSASQPEDLAGFVARLRKAGSQAVVVALGADGDGADFVLPAGFGPRDVESVVREALEKRRLVQQIAMLHQRAEPAPAPDTRAPEVEGATLARVLHELSRLFAARFDLPRMLELFLDAVDELLRPTRSALLLPDDSGQWYRIVAPRGLAPKIAESLRLPAAEGLGAWLVAEARPAQLHELTDPELARELRLLQGVAAVPLLAQGELVAILTVGQPIAGGGYGRQAMQILFDLASHVAGAIHETRLHHQLREREFSERILAHMTSGVITIGRDERIGAVNRRAEEILALKAAEVLHRDLRVLPSPLGDMLLQALATGQALPQAEVQLALPRRWVEVSTGPVRGEDGTPLGAVLVLEDVTGRKEVATRKQQAEQFQLLTRVIGRIADEIKNPLVSINTFVELIEERYDDTDFRKTFSSVVRRDVRRLAQVFEKLAGLVSEGELNCVAVDAREVVDQLATGAEIAEDSPGKALKVDVDLGPEPQTVVVDPRYLRRALAYLVWYLSANSPGEQPHVTLALGRVGANEGAEQVRILVGSKTAAVASERLTRLFDPIYMVQESLVDVGPAVSQRLIEAQGGAVTLRRSHSEVVFEITLPLAAA